MLANFCAAVIADLQMFTGRKIVTSKFISRKAALLVFNHIVTKSFRFPVSQCIPLHLPGPCALNPKSKAKQRNAYIK